MNLQAKNSLPYKTLQKHPHVKYDLAKQFAEWLVSARAQKLIAGYKLVGKQLFYPDAIN